MISPNTAKRRRSSRRGHSGWPVNRASAMMATPAVPNRPKVISNALSGAASRVGTGLSAKQMSCGHRQSQAAPRAGALSVRQGEHAATNSGVGSTPGSC